MVPDVQGQPVSKKKRKLSIPMLRVRVERTLTDWGGDYSDASSLRGGGGRKKERDKERKNRQRDRSRETETNAYVYIP